MVPKWKKLTDRQQFKEWLKESPILDDSERTLTSVFKIAMDYKEEHSDLKLRTLYNYAYLKYTNVILQGDNSD